MNKKKLNIFIYFFVVLFYYLVFELMTNNFLSSLVSVIRYSKYGLFIVSEVCWLSLVLLAIFLFNDGKIFGEKNDGFFKTLFICFPLTISGVFYTLTSLDSLFNSTLLNVVGIAIYSFTIGLTEELLVRGWILNRFFKKYDRKRKEIYLSILFSSLIFGGMHISNIWVGGQTVSETLIQVLFATAAGVFFGTAYFRTRNIIALAFVHGFYDFSLLISDVNLLRDCTTFPNFNITKYQLFINLINSLILVLASLVIMRKSKTNHLFGETVSDEQISKDKELKTRIVTACVVIYIVGYNIPVSFFGVTKEDLSGYKVCYNYPSINLRNVETSYNNYSKFIIENDTVKYLFSIKKGNLVLTVNEKDYQIAPNITDYKVVINDDIYTVYYLQQEDNSNNSIINYSSYLVRNQLSIDENYINTFIKSFIKQGVPPANTLGVIKEDGYDYNFPMLKDYNNNILLIDKKNVVRQVIVDPSKPSSVTSPEENNKVQELTQSLYQTIPYIDFKNIEYLDAYRGQDITIDNLEIKNILNNVYKLSHQEQLELTVYSDNCYPTNPCQGNAYVNNLELINKLKELYNKDLVGIESFNIRNGIVELNNDFWVFLKRENNPEIERINKITDSYFNGKDLVIKEKAGFIYNDTLSKYSDIDNSIITTNNYKETLKNYFKEHSNEFSTFIHTFKYDENNNKYYYYSTQVK